MHVIASLHGPRRSRYQISLTDRVPVHTQNTLKHHGSAAYTLALVYAVHAVPCCLHIYKHSYICRMLTHIQVLMHVSCVYALVYMCPCKRV